MRTHNLTKTFNTALFLSGLFFIALSVQKLFLESKTLNFNLKESIGLVEKYQNDVRLKKVGDLNWNFVEEKDVKLHLNDSVFTNNDSTVDLDLAGNQKIKLKSESLLKIRKQDEIILQSGELELEIKKGAKPLALVLGNKKLKISSQTNSKVTITNNQKQNEILVTQGAIKIESKQADINFNAGEKVDLNENELVVEHASTDLIYPRGTIFLKRGEKLIPHYKTNKKVKSILLKRSDMTFSLAPNEGISLRGDRYTFSLAFTDTNIKSPSSEFELIKLINSPELNLPKNNAQFMTYENEIEIVLNWSPKTKAKIYQLQVLDEFQNVIQSHLISNINYQIKIAQPGHYYWRVRAYENYLQSEFSRLRSFKVIQENLEQLEAIKIELKKPNQAVSFNWEKQDNNDVVFRLSKDPTFQNEVLTKTTKKSNVSITIPDTGVYYWSVKTKDGFLKPKKVLITPTPAPTRAPRLKNIKYRLKSSQLIKEKLIDKIINFFISSAHASNNEEINIKWEAFEEAKFYEIEIYAKDSTRPKLKKIIQKNSFKWTPPSTGQFFYRVRYQDFWKRWSPYSEKAQIQILAAKPKKRSKTKKISPKKVSKKKLKMKEEKLIQELQAFYSANSLNSTQKGNSQYEIDGLSATGHALEITSRKLIYGSSLKLNYLSQYGTVFNDAAFNQRDLDFTLHKQLKMLYLGVGVGLHQYSIFEGTNQDEVDLAALENTQSILLRAQYPLIIGSNYHFMTNLALRALGINEFNLGLSYRHYLKMEFSPIIKLNVISRSYSGLSDKVNYQSNQLLIGVFKEY
jgi:hypothetical protein